jgi:hypothetical protein
MLGLGLNALSSTALIRNPTRACFNLLCIDFLQLMLKYTKYIGEVVAELAKQKTKEKQTKITIEAGRSRRKPPRLDQSSPHYRQLSGLLNTITDLEDFMNAD